MQVKKYLELLLVWNAESRRFGICFLLNLTVLLGVAFILGVFSAEFLGADEASHVVTGIMVEQYLTRGVWEGKGAMEFASDYYAHYPFFCDWALAAGILFFRGGVDCCCGPESRERSCVCCGDFGFAWIVLQLVVPARARLVAGRLCRACGELPASKP